MSGVRNLTACLLSCGVLLTSRIGLADDPPPPKFEVHEWSVWVGEPQGKAINSVADFTSAMPGIVETDRSRRRETTKPGPTPMSLLTLYGEPPEFVDVDLRVASGRPVAQWPKSDGKSNRLRWLDLKVTVEPEKLDSLVTVPEGHWFEQARQLGGLYIQMPRSTRIERFLTYDLELQSSLTLRVDQGPEKIQIANLGKHPLHDLLLIVPTEKGHQIGWLDTIPAAPKNEGAANPPPQQNPPSGGNAANPPKPPETLIDCNLSEPLSLESEDYRQQTADAYRKRLTELGLSDAEVDLMFALHAKEMFQSDEMQLVFRLAPEALDEMAPLSVEPETAKIKRVALIVVRKVDPKLREDIDKLILELGDAAFAKREQAETRLRELGRLAVPKLKDALKNSDLEVVVRAERLLLEQKEPLGAEAN